MKRIISIALVVAAAINVINAETVYLTNGAAITGTITESTDKYIVIKTNGETRFISRKLIDRIESEETQQMEVPVESATTIASPEVMRGYEEGRRDGKGGGTGDACILWVIPGCCCSCYGVGAAYLWPRSVPVGKLLGQSSEYVRGYTSSYKNAKRRRETTYAIIGCIPSCTINCIYSLYRVYSIYIQVTEDY